MTTLTSMAQPATSPDPLQQFKKRAAKFNAVISLPQFESTTNEIRASVRLTITNGNASLDTIGALQPRKVSCLKGNQH